MNRLQELKQKISEVGGFMGLTAEEKKEYQALKAEAEQTPVEPKQTPKNANKEPTITLTKTELQQMIAEGIKEAQANAPAKTYKQQVDEWKKAEPEVTRNRTAKIRMYREDAFQDPGLIIDLKDTKKPAFNEETRKHDVLMYKIWVRYDDGQVKEYELPLVQLVQNYNEFEDVEIVDQKEEEQVKVVGKGQMPRTGKGGHKFSSPIMFGIPTRPEDNTGETFDLEVRRKFVTVTVKRPNGQLLTINADRLNQ